MQAVLSRCSIYTVRERAAHSALCVVTFLIFRLLTGCVADSVCFMLQGSRLSLNLFSVALRLPFRAASNNSRLCGAATAQLSTMAAREIAVVGGGVSGLYCATELSNHGYKVTVFDLGKHAPGESKCKCLATQDIWLLKTWRLL